MFTSGVISKRCFTSGVLLVVSLVSGVLLVVSLGIGVLLVGSLLTGCTCSNNYGVYYFVTYHTSLAHLVRHRLQLRVSNKIMF